MANQLLLPMALRAAHDIATQLHAMSTWRERALLELHLQALRHKRARVRWLPETVAVLARSSFSGNVRELDAVVQQVLQGVHVGDIEPARLPPEPRRRPGRVLTRLQQLECDAIQGALAEAQGKRNHAARSLGICRATLYRKLANYGIASAATDRPRPGAIV